MPKLIIIGLILFLLYISYIKGKSNKKKLKNILIYKYSGHECICDKASIYNNTLYPSVSQVKEPTSNSGIGDIIDIANQSPHISIVRDTVLNKIGSHTGIGSGVHQIYDLLVNKLPRFDTSNNQHNVSSNESYKASSGILEDVRSYIDKDSIIYQYNNGDLNYVVSNGGKGEDICRRVLEEIIGVKFDCVRPSFLKNPKTNYNLELDMYNHDAKIALEYDGEHHYKIGKYTKSVEDLNYIRWKDRYKDEVCNLLGITLIRVPYTISLDKIPDYIIDKLKETGVVEEL